jgi:hypothetical protein
MENLTKQQIVLLTLLVSFVTSIATGIVTVALMNQAPVGVTQTINRVVEKTIEKVVPATPTKETQTIVKETVVVNTDDQIVSAVEKNSKSIVRIYSRENSRSYDSDSVRFVSLGTVVSDNNIIVADNNTFVFDGGRYFIKTEDNKNVDLEILRAVPGEEVSVFKIKENGDYSVKLSKANIVSSENIKLGQTVVYIGGDTKDIVSTGIISGVNTKNLDNNSTSTEKIITSIETNISSDKLISGGLLINLSGEIVAIKTNYPDFIRTDLFAPANYIESSLNKVILSTNKTE